MDLSDKVAVITGSGRGIGRAIALELARAGAAIVINDIGEEPAQKVAEEVKALGRPAQVILADVSSAAEAARLIDTAKAGFGKIDILVNNAGITRDQLLMRMTDEDWDKVININLKSVFFCTRAVLRDMLNQRSGRIISLASVVGIVGNRGQANYAASKAGIIGFTRSIAKEVASRGVTVNAVAPGFIDTEMTQRLKEEWKEQVRKQIPLGYFGTPQDIAGTVAFLASEAARYITGQVISVDGGLAMSWL